MEQEAELIDEDPPQDVIAEAEAEVVQDVPNIGPVSPPPPLPPIGSVTQGDIPLVNMGAVSQNIVLPVTTLPPDDSQLVAELEARRAALTAQVEKIEAMIGFVASGAELAVRVAKIERFLGL